MQELENLYLQLDVYGDMHISSLESIDDEIYFYDEEKVLLKQIIDLEIDYLLKNEDFVKVNHGSKEHHANNILNNLYHEMNSIVIGCFNRGEDFDSLKVKKYIRKELDIFLPQGHMTSDFPKRLKKVLSLEKEDQGERYQLDNIIEVNYDKILEPYLIRRNITFSHTYKKDGSNYDFYLNKVKDNLFKALTKKALTYDYLQSEDQLIFKESGKLMKYIRTAIVHTLPKAKNGIYHDEFEVQSSEVDIDSLKSYREDTNVDKQLAQFVIRQAVEENIRLENAIKAREKMLDYLRDVLSLDNAPHHILMFLDITWVNKVPGVIDKDLYDTKTPSNKISLDRYYQDIFYDIKEKIEYSINEHLLHYTDHKLDEEDYEDIDYNLAHNKPYGKSNVIGEYMLKELSPTVTNVTKWKERIEKEMEKNNG